MKELQHAGKVRVVLIPTDDNVADLFTKVLGNAKFAEHRAAVYNMAARSSGGEASTALGANESES